MELPDIPGRRAVTASAAERSPPNRPDPSRFPRAGEFTNNGIGATRYDILNGVSAPQKWRLLPQYGAHASRVPVHTLESVGTQRALLSDEAAAHRPPTSRAAGVTHGVDTGRVYAAVSSAFQPAGFRSPAGSCGRAGILSCPTASLCDCLCLYVAARVSVARFVFRFLVHVQLGVLELGCSSLTFFFSLFSTRVLDSGA